MGKYVENLFFANYFMNKNKCKKKFVDIENIINSEHIITDIPVTVSEWYYINRNHLSWEYFNSNKHNIDKIIVDCINNNFNKNIKLSEHTIVNDSYFKSFILHLKDDISKNYKKYLKTKNAKKLRKYLFEITVVIYSLETQHYFHTANKGAKFRNILTLYKKMFRDIERFAKNTSIDIHDNNICVSNHDMVGEIDFLENKNNKFIIWELKSVSDISLKHILQVMMYNIMYHDHVKQNNCVITCNFINFMKGEMIELTLNLSQDDINKIVEIFKKSSALN